MSTRRYGRKTISYPTIKAPHRTSRFSHRLTTGVTWTDLFCGGGGSTTGIKKSAGDVVIASNHWQLAVDTHETNHPDAFHVCEDISAADPRNYPSTTGLWASAECTWHSPAGGRARPTKQQALCAEWEPERNEQAERSRVTMWDIPRFAEAHGYKMIIVENVVEVLDWPLFPWWWQAMTEGLGYEGRRVSLNSMFCWPTPQSRDRIYFVFWKRGMPAPDLDIRPLAYCPRCAVDVSAIQSWKNGRTVGKYKRQYVYCCPRCAGEVTPYYYCAANAIDWTQPIERIGDRKHELKPKTIQRIQAGLEKYGRNPLLLVDRDRGQPFVLAAGSGGRALGIADEAMPTATASSQPHFIVPWLLEVGHGGPENAGRIKGIMDAMPTMHTLAGVGVAMAPYLVQQEYGDSHKALPAIDPFATQSTRRATGLMLAPMVFSRSRGDGRHQTVDEPFVTLTTRGDDQALMYAPMLVDNGGGWESGARLGHEPYPTQTSHKQPGMLMAPYLVIERAHADARGVTDPCATVATGNHHGLALAPHPFTLSYNGSLNEPLSALDDPLSTTTSVQRHGVGFAGMSSGDGHVLPAVADCYYRTLKAHEIKRAMGFPDSYVLLGDARSQVKMAGNAVTPPTAAVLAARVMASMEGTGGAS